MVLIGQLDSAMMGNAFQEERLFITITKGCFKGRFVSMFNLEECSCNRQPGRRPPRGPTKRESSTLRLIKGQTTDQRNSRAETCRVSIIRNNHDSASYARPANFRRLTKYDRRLGVTVGVYKLPPPNRSLHDTIQDWRTWTARNAKPANSTHYDWPLHVLITRGRAASHGCDPSPEHEGGSRGSLTMAFDSVVVRGDTKEGAKLNFVCQSMAANVELWPLVRRIWAKLQSRYQPGNQPPPRRPTRIFHHWSGKCFRPAPGERLSIVADRHGREAIDGCIGNNIRHFAILHACLAPCR